MLAKKTLDRIPPQLATYVVDQDYEKYTARDHAVWRFIMRNAKEFLSEHAHPSYLSGLEKTGVPINYIPHVSEMDARLSEFGWGAVCVRGFIPPLVFLEFQSNRILPIAADMRSLEHFDYTPAPDIVHEAAGHAPILADQGYREYLAKYAQVARRAIFSIEDVRLYEAIRVLSDVKENPDSTPQLIMKAEEELHRAYQSITWVSEAAKVARMYWWSVEYGLIGDLKQPMLYGAGLLSSLGESRDCLDTKVKKVPFSLACIEASYDITEPQPQLFVAKDFSELMDVLEELEKSLAFRKGGVEALSLAHKAQSLCTVRLDSGIEVSGVLVEFTVEKDHVVFLKWGGPVQLCYEGSELKGQGRQRHPDGFSGPIGKWLGINDSKSPSDLSDNELVQIGLRVGQVSQLTTQAGFKIVGHLKSVTRNAEGKILLLSWVDCTVLRQDKVYFDPSWGEFDLAVGESVISVYGGPADWRSFGEGDFGKSSTQPGRMTPFLDREKQLFSLYQDLRSLREEAGQLGRENKILQLQKIAEKVHSSYPEEWLIAIEIIELFHSLTLREEDYPWFDKMTKRVLDLTKYSKNQARFMQMGINKARSL